MLKQLFPCPFLVLEGGFIDFVELVLAKSGSSFTVGEVQEDYDYHLLATDP